MNEENMLKADIVPGVALNHKAMKNIRAKRPLERDAQIAVDRNRWFLVTCILLLLLFFACFSAYQANQRFANNVKVSWVKLYPNGTWDIDFHDENRGAEFFPATIDYLLRQFVERRFSKIAHSIRYDYGFAAQLMGTKLRREFIDSKQVNAPQLAADLEHCSNCDEVYITTRNIDHYESEQTVFARQPGTLYRSNIFVREIIKARDGSIRSQLNKIVSLHWRIKSAAEIQAHKEQLKINPIGLEILKADYLNDPTSVQQSKGERYEQ